MKASLSFALRTTSALAVLLTVGGCQCGVRELGAAFVRNEKRSFLSMCSLELKPGTKAWALREIERRLALGKESYAQDNYSAVGIAAFEENYQSFSEFVVKNPNAELLSLYWGFHPGDAMSEVQIATIGQILGEKPDLFFAWDGCGAAAERVMANRELAFASERLCSQYARRLESYTADRSVPNWRIARDCLEAFKSGAPTGSTSYCE
jgi:hypothetical protein